jgi:2-polyprenyl-6-methoxyphenol hydroxylase-like FAD-dependent oxidoreductase
MISGNRKVNSNTRVGIIGAGASGAYLASLLVQQGFKVDLFEKASSPRTEGCGILLIQAGMEVLYQRNPEVCQKIINSGTPVRKFEFRNPRGEVFQSESVTYQENELPGMLVHRKPILEALLEGVPQECLHLNAQFESLIQKDQSVVVQFKDDSYWEGDLLIAADGIFSKVRNFVVPGVAPSYLGDIVWRGVVSDKQFCQDGDFIVYTRSRGIYANFFDLGGDRTHWGFFIEAEQNDSEKGKPRPQNIVIPPEELAKLPDEPRAIIESTPPEQITCRYSYDINPLPQLYNGRIVLIGDAAHAKSPTRARGMTSGWEDALALSRHLTAHSDLEQALENFQAERIPIVHEYQRTSREISMKTRKAVA